MPLVATHASHSRPHLAPMAPPPRSTQVGAADGDGVRCAQGGKRVPRLLPPPYETLRALHTNLEGGKYGCVGNARDDDQSRSTVQDPEDVMDTVHWAKKNEAKAKEIAKQAQELALQYLSNEVSALELE